MKHEDLAECNRLFGPFCGHNVPILWGELFENLAAFESNFLYLSKYFGFEDGPPQFFYFFINPTGYSLQLNFGMVKMRKMFEFFSYFFFFQFTLQFLILYKINDFATAGVNFEL